MARAYAKVFRDIWADPDFRALEAAVRYVYLFLISQPNLNAAGVLPLTIRRWADLAGGISAVHLESDLAILVSRRFILIDRETEELLVRTFIRNDGLWRIPNTLYAVIRGAERTVSATLRASLACELASLPVDSLDGKRAEAMKLQVSTVVVTLSATVEPTVEPTSGMRVRYAGVVEGSSSALEVETSVVNQSSVVDARESKETIEEVVIQEIRKATGKDVDHEWAGKIAGHILKGRSPSDPAAYIRKAIRDEPDPRKRFLPLY